MGNIHRTIKAKMRKAIWAIGAWIAKAAYSDRELKITMTTPTPTKKGISLWWGNHPEWLSLPFVAIPPFIQAWHIDQGEDQCAFFVVEGRNDPLRYYIKRPVDGKLELYGPAYEKQKA